MATATKKISRWETRHQDQVLRWEEIEKHNLKELRGRIGDIPEPTNKYFALVELKQFKKGDKVEIETPHGIKEARIFDIEKTKDGVYVVILQDSLSVCPVKNSRIWKITSKHITTGKVLD